MGCSDSKKKIKKHAEKKANNLPNKTKFKDVTLKTIYRKKMLFKMLVNPMLNVIQEKGLNENADIDIKVRKYPGASSTYILLDHIKTSLRKEPDQILIHTGTKLFK